MPLANIIKNIRLSAGYSQRELAKEINIAQNSVSFYESGAREPTYKTLRKLVEFAEKHGIEITIRELVDKKSN